MAKRDSYLKRAANLGLAPRTDATAEKARLLGVAEAWLTLVAAEKRARAHKRSATLGSRNPPPLRRAQQGS